MTSCWIIHQPDERHGIVCDIQNRQLMFHTRDEAEWFYFSNLLFKDGFICQRLPDADAFIAASNGDGCGASWYQDPDGMGLMWPGGVK